MSAMPSEIVQMVAQRFSTFGGGRTSDFNPITHWMKDEPLKFAMGVGVSEVVACILDAVAAMAEEKAKDRDYEIARIRGKGMALDYRADVAATEAQVLRDFAAQVRKMKGEPGARRS